MPAARVGRRAGCGKSARPVRRGAGLRARDGAPRLLYWFKSFCLKILAAFNDIDTWQNKTFNRETRERGNPSGEIPNFLQETEETEIRKSFLESVVIILVWFRSSDPPLLPPLPSVQFPAFFLRASVVHVLIFAFFAIFCGNGLFGGVPGHHSV